VKVFLADYDIPDTLRKDTLLYDHDKKLIIKNLNPQLKN
jgi:hypothetical protein